MNEPHNTNSPDMPQWERFMRLYLANERRLYGFVMAMIPNWSDVDDLIQKTAMVMWAKFSEFEPGTDFSAWALCIARYQVLDYRKRKRTDKLRFSISTIDAINEKFIEATANDNLQQRREALQHCLARLTPADRKLLDLRYRPDATIRSVSEYLGRSIHSLYKVLNRIHAQLLQCMRHYMTTQEVL
jgi:RNA polymerase sigma-70 factor (ECF subfamily)